MPWMIKCFKFITGMGEKCDIWEGQRAIVAVANF